MIVTLLLGLFVTPVMSGPAFAARDPVKAPAAKSRIVTVGTTKRYVGKAAVVTVPAAGRSKPIAVTSGSRRAAGSAEARRTSGRPAARVASAAGVVVTGPTKALARGPERRARVLTVDAAGTEDVDVGALLVDAQAVADAAEAVASRGSGAGAADDAEEGGKPAVVVAPVLTAHQRECQIAQSGNAHAAYMLGRRYMFGLGVGRSRNLGIAWMRFAAQRGHPLARRVVDLVPRRWGQGMPSCSTSAGGGGGMRRLGPVKPPEEVLRMVHEIAPRYQVDPRLVLAVMQVESGFSQRAVSPKAAAGLMQLIPDTAQRFGVTNSFDARQNVTGGVRYLQWLLAYFRGDVTLAVAGYNAGEGAVDRYGGVPPYAETQQYVRLIRGLYANIRHPYDARITAPSTFVRSQVAEMPQ